MNSPLFRDEVMQERAGKWAGTIVLARPVSLRLAGWLSALLLAALIVFLWTGGYTRTVRVSGAFVGVDDARYGAGASMTTTVPSDGVVAQLLVPSRSIGFVESGQTVLLRIAAFPYQKFGHIRGTVVRVDSSPVRTAGNAEGLPAVDSMYVVTVVPDRQTIRANGKERPFLKGMTLEADIQQERRRLVEWFLEP